MKFSEIKAGISYGQYNEFSHGHIYVCLEINNDIASFIHFDVNYRSVDIIKINKKAWNATYLDGNTKKHNYGFHKLKPTEILVTPEMAIHHVFTRCEGYKWGSMFPDAIL